MIGSIFIKSRLQRKLFLAMFAIGIIPLASAGVFAFYSVNVSHKVSVASIEKNLINQKHEEIKAFVNEAIQIIQLELLVNNLEKDLNVENKEILLRGVLRDNKYLEEISLLTITGIEMGRVVRDKGGLEYIDGSINKSKTPEFISIVEKQLVDKNYDIKAEYKYISEPFTTLDGTMLNIASVARNGAQNIIGVVTARLNLSNPKVEEKISSAPLGLTGQLYLLDKNGNVIAGASSNLNVGENEIISSLISGADFLGKDIKRYVGIGGNSVVASGKYLPEFGLVIVAEWPVKEANAILNQLVYQIVVFSISALIGILILSAFLAGRIVGPIKKLEEGTASVAKGKFDNLVDIKTGDELEELGVSFNKMTAGLKELQALKDEFVFIAAHELKTPVAAIKGYLSIINDGLAGPVSVEVKGFIGKVLNANARLIRLVEDLLEVARSEAGKIKVDVAPIDISAVVNETLGELKPLADEKGITMAYTAGSIQKVMADAGRVREILVNLIGNSIKYTLTNGGIEILHEMKDGQLITHVKDHGMGMSKEAQGKLFEKFYRVQTKETLNITGTGLGLFIVKQIVEKMNGKIWVESDLGKGSTFSFSLPVAA